MSKAVAILAKIDPSLKQLAENILDELGLTPSQAITLFYKQVALRKGLPFKIEIPGISTPDEEKADWTILALNSLDDAYGQHEPEYSLHLIRETNPEYQA